MSAGGAFVAPDERRGSGIPPLDRRFQPGDDLLGRLRVVPFERSPFEDALDGLGHIEPAARERRIEHHDAVGEQPEHQLRGVVARQVVPDEQEAQRRQLGRQGDPDVQSLLPACPLRAVGHWIGHRRRLGQGREPGRHRLLEPGVQDAIGASPHALGVHLARRGAQEGQELGCPCAQVFVRLARGMACGLPADPRGGHGLERARLILARQGDPARLRLAVGLLNQPLLASASGSWTVTRPPLRLRTAVPVGHQVRVRCQVQPDSLNTHQMV